MFKIFETFNRQIRILLYIFFWKFDFFRVSLFSLKLPILWIFEFLENFMQPENEKIEFIFDF